MASVTTMHVPEILPIYYANTMPYYAQILPITLLYVFSRGHLTQNLCFSSRFTVAQSE